MTNHRLSEGDSAIIGGDEVMRIDLKTIMFQALFDKGKEKDVLKNPSA